jgi:pyruvate dehydrogenase E2 component (dihydrolipoamide acetyltransferase)
MAGVIEIRVPDLGDFKGVAVIDLLVKPGDAVEVDTPLVTLETDKATMDVPSSAAGIVEKLHIAKGGKVSAGDLVATLRAEGDVARPKETKPAGAPAAPRAAAKTEAPKPAPAKAAAAAVAPAPAQAAAPAPAGPVGPVEVRVPDMGDFKEVAVIDVLVKPGDSVEVDAPLVTLETDKATMDVPSTVAGVVEKVHVAKGGKISPGDAVVTVRGSAPQAAAAPAKIEAAAPPPAAAAPATAPASRGPAPAAEAPRAAAAPARITSFDGALPAIDEPGFSRAHAGPSVRRLAREMGVNLAQVSGTGIKGRITHDDVKAYVKKVLTGAGAGAGGAGRALPAVPEVDFSKFGPVETKPLSRIQKISGPRLQASWLNIPHVTQFDEADITALEDVRNKLKQKASQEGIKLTPLAFVVRACVRALQEFPQFNASLDASGENLILKKYIHVGFAADTPNGLVVPVVRDADRCDIYEIARKLAELAEKARAGKLTSAEMQGGCFTISSLGGIGGTAFTPIVNAPEVAILGVSRSSMKPVFDNGAFVPRLMLPLSLSYDHRVIDGAAGARFSAFLVKTLSDPRALTEAVP